MAEHRYPLTKVEMRDAAYVGVERQLEAIALGLKDKHGFFGDPWGSHIEGAIGEYVFCKHFSQEWEPTINTFKQPDVGPYQIRCMKDLIIRTAADGASRDDGDASDEPFVWIKPESRRVYVVKGWIWGADAPLLGTWRGWGPRPKAWFINEVKPIETLPSVEAAYAAKRPSSNGQDTGLSSRERGVQLPPGAPPS